MLSHLIHMIDRWIAAFVIALSAVEKGIAILYYST
jgi:hypothetical protein